MSQSPGPRPSGGPQGKCRGPVEQGARPLLPGPPSLPGPARADQLPAFPGRVASPRRRTRQAGAPPGAAKGRAKEGWPGVGALLSSQSHPGPLSPGEGKRSLIFLFCFPLAAASLLTRCLAATAVLWFLRTPGRNRRGQGQRKQSTAVARALTSWGGGVAFTSRACGGPGRGVLQPQWSVLTSWLCPSPAL